MRAGIALAALIVLIVLGAIYGDHTTHPGTLDLILKH